MIVELVMQSKPVSVSADTPVREAAKRMREQAVRVLPVTEADQVAGVVTPWILTARVLAESDRSADTVVAHVMSKDRIWCKPEERLEDVTRRMHEHFVMQLPVIDSRWRPIGMIHYRDVTAFAREHSKPTASSLL